MSRILWSNVLVPAPEQAERHYSSEYYPGSINIPRTKALPIDHTKSPLPDRKAHRAMSRAAVLLSLACLDGKRYLQPILSASPFDVGIYCAIENGPIDLPSASAMLKTSDAEFADAYRKLRNPKSFLKQVPNLAPAQMAIFLGIMGPMNVYNHSAYGSLHAMDQAEIDVLEGRVQAALVCSAFSFEDPLVVERVHRSDSGQRLLCEGAGAMLLAADGSFTDWSELDCESSQSYFGISDQLITHLLSLPSGVSS